MTAFRDPDDLIVAYLEDGPTELSRDSYEAVDRRTRRTRQRTVLGPWRNRPMSNLSRALVGAAAVVLAVVGLALVRGPAPGPSSVGAPSSSPPAAISPSTVPSASLSAGVYSWVRSLGAGTYSTSFSWDPLYQFTFTVGDGWTARDTNIDKADRMAVAFYPIRDVVTNACGRALPATSAATSASNLVTALRELVTIDTGPLAQTIGSRAATYVEFVPPQGASCGAEAMTLFQLPDPTCPPGICSGVGEPWIGFEFGTDTQHNRLWLMDVGRRVVAIHAAWTDEATPAELAELQAVIDSVRLDTPLATQAPQAEPVGS
jgi:hypothetical protein